MKEFSDGWYLIYTKPRHEKKVAAELTDKKIASFLPMTKKLRTWSDRKKFIEEPLFPSYVFIYLRDLQDYYDGIDVEGFLYYVRMGKRIARVSDTVVKNIQLAVTQTHGLEVSDSHFEPGQKAVISEGPLTGLSCELIQVDRNKKLLIRVDLLKRNILLSVSADHLITV